MSQNILPTKLFHGTTDNHRNSLEVGININILGANPRPDFGVGFYLTSNMEQAQEQALRKTKFANKRIIRDGSKKLVQPIVFEYELDIEQVQINNCKIFDKPDTVWGNFILSNRTHTSYGNLNNINQTIPLVYGPVADGKPNIAVLLDDLKKNKITHQEALRGIMPWHPWKDGNVSFDQLSIHTEEAKNWISRNHIWEVEQA
ncbi:hypothetical protein ASD24_26820 [Paenibacillus sp. Root52]|uniref:DUF3990 domain-containing protein n=1 Tax=Paenibacillus sp. Root52 TaxID=1736552 RepID=UPI0006FE5363|nr:DUF3990 domain-containing protein [Paenibacillus sp. Root52]KQY87091.1 hypothetical protein ASD24_26820 [Paenibacillus sp. Root52]